MEINKNQTSEAIDNKLHIPTPLAIEIGSTEMGLGDILKALWELNDILRHGDFNFNWKLQYLIYFLNMLQELKKFQTLFFLNSCNKIMGSISWWERILCKIMRSMLPRTEKLIRKEDITDSSNPDSSSKAQSPIAGEENITSSPNVNKNTKTDVTFLLETADLDTILEEFENFHARYSKFFQTKTRNVSKQAKQYTQGLIFSEGHGNMVKFAKKVPHSNNQSLQHFISNSPFNDEPLVMEIQNNIIGLIGDEKHGSLHLDEKAFSKDGNHSVGVQRQYGGNMGKVDNCQMGVFLGYLNTKNNAYIRSLMDERLYLPKKWVEDLEMRKKCGVPEDIVFKTKAELGLEMVLNAKKRKVPFSWLGMDCHYGEQPWLLDELDNESIIYIADAPSNTRVWLEKPKIEIPACKGNRGRKPTKEKLVEGEPCPIEVRKIGEQLTSSQWHDIFLRDTERGELWSQIAFLRVYPVRDGLPGKKTWLIIRKDGDKNETKYQLSNASANTSKKRLAEMSCSRFWIERMFEDANGVGGLSDYEVRSWKGWHRHITMSMLVMLFFLTLIINMGAKAPMLTFQDVREILDAILPKKEVTKETILKEIMNKHKARLSARLSHHKRNNKEQT